MNRDNDDEQLLVRVARVFRALGESTRLRILCALAKGEQTVNGIVAAVGAPQTSVSRHLQVLHHANLVSRRRDGARVLYRVASPMIAPLCRRIAASLAADSMVRLPAAVVRSVFQVRPSSTSKPRTPQPTARKGGSTKRGARAGVRP